MQLDRMQIEQRRDIDQRRQRRVAKHADGQHARTASGTGQRRCFVRRDMARAARHEDEAGKCRRPGGVEIAATVEATQFRAAENQCARSLRRDRPNASATSR